MLCKEVIQMIEQSYPVEYALDWDNVGLLAGRDDKDVRRIYVALDATDEVIEAAVQNQADMLITHHPLIFSPLKKINNQNFISARILKLIQQDISYYAMHTNYDVLGMAELSGKKLGLGQAEVLEVTRQGESAEGIGRIAHLETPVLLSDCCKWVKEAFHLDKVKVFGNLEQSVSKLAISPGSGKSVIPTALSKHADVIVTGDIDHHEGIDAAAQGLAVIDAGHYGIEHIFVGDMKEYLEKNLAGVIVTAAPICHPFQIV